MNLLVDGELVGDLYHSYNPSSTNVHGDGSPHLATIYCWCEPQLHHFGYDCAQRAILVLNHHEKGLFCCTNHANADQHENIPIWLREFNEQLIGSGPFSDDSELGEEAIIARC